MNIDNEGFLSEKVRVKMLLKFVVEQAVLFPKTLASAFEKSDVTFKLEWRDKLETKIEEEERAKTKTWAETFESLKD